MARCVATGLAGGVGFFGGPLLWRALGRALTTVLGGARLDALPKVAFASLRSVRTRR